MSAVYEMESEICDAQAAASEVVTAAYREKVLLGKNKMTLGARDAKNVSQKGPKRIEKVEFKVKTQGLETLSMGFEANEPPYRMRLKDVVTALPPLCGRLEPLAPRQTGQANCALRKPFALCRSWAWRVLDEFFEQGDEELFDSFRPISDCLGMRRRAGSLSEVVLEGIFGANSLASPRSEVVEVAVRRSPWGSPAAC